MEEENQRANFKNQQRRTQFTDDVPKASSTFAKGQYSWVEK